MLWHAIEMKTGRLLGRPVLCEFDVDKPRYSFLPIAKSTDLFAMNSVSFATTGVL